jgi:superfamily II DNA or RNA helicase
MAPHAKIGFSLSGSSDRQAFADDMTRIPGLKLKDGLWTVPYNAVHVVNAIARKHGATVGVARWVDPPSTTLSWAEIEVRLREQGELREWVFDFLTQYQKDAVSFGWNKSGVHYWHPTGSGKSITGIVTALSVSGPIIVVTRAASRIQFAREIERFINARAFIVRPASVVGPVKVKGETFNRFRSRHKGQGLSAAEMATAWEAHKLELGVDRPPTMQEYLQKCHQVGARPFVVIGWEMLTDRVAELKAIQPASIVFDELHRGKSTKRSSVVHLADLDLSDPVAAEQTRAQEEKEMKAKGGFVKDTPDGRKAFLPVVNTANAAAELSRVARKRAGLTATSVKDRVRDLWAQLDIVEPNCWGSSTIFRTRYCDMKPGVYGGMDDKGASHEDELKMRLSSAVHILDYRETHRSLPAKRRQPMYIAPEDQNGERGGFVQELKRATKLGASAVLEVKLAIAASRKRKAVLGAIEEHLNSGQKVVVFTGRRKDCDELGEDVRKLADKKGGSQVWSAHGEQSTDARQDILDEYMAHPGPCCLVATGDSFGESMNIQRTDAAFFVMLPYTPGQLVQWEGRFCRLGQDRPCIIYYVIAEGSVDEHIAEILISKLPSVEKIAQNHELAEAKGALAGYEETTPEEFATSVLACLDLD